MAGPTLYRYGTIRHNQIRLLKFIRDENRISAILKTFAVDQPLPPYHSISYAWALDGNGPTKSFTLQVDQRLLPVLDSLEPFFQTLRSKGMLLDGKWWWIDSICINQADLEERAQQLQHMQLIYCQAEQVIAWLGEASSDSDLAINFIKFLDQTARRKPSVAELRSMLQADHYRAHWTALANFLARKWWSRIWTVQEFVRPTSLSFWCGMRNVSRVAVCRSIKVADQCTSVGIKGMIAFSHGNNRRRAWNLYKAGKKPGANLSLSLVALAAYFCCMDATDDRDRLYGLMALCTNPSILQVDYFLSAPEVYLRFTQSFIEEHKSLDVICLASTYSALPGSLRPSWVPDWQKRNPVVIPSMASQSCKTHVGNLRGPDHLEFDASVHYSASHNTAAVYEFEGSALHARGVVVDTVDGLAGSTNFEMVQSSEWNSAQCSGCSDSMCSTTELLISVCRSLVLDRKDRYLRYAMPTADFFWDFMCLLARIVTQSDPSTPKELQEWFRWTRSLQIHGRSFESILLHARAQDDYGSTGAAPNEDEYYHDTFFGRFFDTVVRLSLRLMVSRNGRIGMVTEKAMKGDLVCVLFGCSIPVLLRKSESKDGFSLVGECFLDGYMTGAALGLPELKERTFIIW
ncbi:hypothetical protein ACRALDRAFT_1093265 [Sodiomyces alcalophilus JCM 7366]|uniref:uncharacterized protein n=1 Tax=Sodiomyces alcalophilus JCM 7366 TaxID=591952 RepID=UPI0039B511C9